MTARLLLKLFIAVTAYNFLYDYIFDRLWEKTIQWEYGILLAFIPVFIFLPNKSFKKDEAKNRLTRFSYDRHIPERRIGERRK